MALKSDRTAQPPEADVMVQVINPRAVVIGLLFFALIIAAMFFIRLAGQTSAQKKLTEFEFTVDQPDKEEFELKEPIRDIMREQVEEMDQIEIEERPDIQMTVMPTEVEVVETVIQSRNIDVITPDIQVDAIEIDIDAPEEITEISETVEFAVPVIAAELPQPADIFSYETPPPPDKPARYTHNVAPRPSRHLKVLPNAFGDQDAPAMGELGPMNVNLFGSGDFFRAMTGMGGIHARSAVDSALHWLAVRQEPEGHWDTRKWEGSGSLVGNTGLTLMAFMGGGHNTRRGEYRRTVLRGIEWLLNEQQSDGKIGATMYEHSIAAIALCEAFGRSGDERFGGGSRRAITWLERAQNADGGWRYHPNSEMSDVSVTAWVIQAMKTARLANIRVDNSVYARALLYLDSLTDRGGRAGSSGAVGYTYESSLRYSNNRPAMTSAGMVIRQFSGTGVRSDLLKKGAELTMRHPPQWSGKDFYFWYYATYAMHNMGDEYRLWWNRRIRDVLIENQVRTGEDAGSWDPRGDRWAGQGGRVYTTALGALCLQVYYRYSDALNSFGVAPSIDDLFLR